jgi:hypothetical protein
MSFLSRHDQRPVVALEWRARFLKNQVEHQQADRPEQEGHDAAGAHEVQDAITISSDRNSCAPA